MDSGDANNNNNNNRSVPTSFSCSNTRAKSIKNQFADERLEDIKIFNTNCFPYFKSIIQREEASDYNNQRERLGLENYHDLFPLFWCKNKHDTSQEKCEVCMTNLEIGTDYLLCVTCDQIYHKECVESPLEINHPYHPEHPLKLCYFENIMDCVLCLKPTSFLVYHCILCNFSIDSICVQKPIPLVIDKPKRHDHSMVFFTRKVLLDCNVCGLINKIYPTYVCFKCNFVAHKDCIHFPSVIRISRHHHQISFVSSLPLGKWCCGVCRTKVDSRYGAYICNKCKDYVVHSRCALRKDICDGKELENELDEDDTDEIIEPFEKISHKVILYFLHDHYLKQEICGKVYDESKICHACVLPIFEGNFYSCLECNFILHDSCANAPTKRRNPLHPHPITLKVTSGYNEDGFFCCDACGRLSSGFVYECSIDEGWFKLDMRCASISEPFIYEGHKHPLYLALDPREKNFCYVCQHSDMILINCIECDFIICLRCVNLPCRVRYKHDKHFLTLNHCEETNEADWCEVCERLLITEEDNKRFYRCEQCCTTLHISCLFGKDLYMNKPGHIITAGVKKLQIISNNYLSRPTCYYCSNRCADKIFFKTLKKEKKPICSMHHYLLDKM